MVTAKKSGAEVIPFIKTYVNLPAAIGFTALYSKLCDRMEQRDVFYACTIPFLLFFLAFAFVIFPHVDMLHPHLFVDQIASRLPEGFGAPLAIVRNWSFAVFYVMAEMWGSVVASLLFWSFANEVTTVDEAKKYCEFKAARLPRHRVYPLFHNVYEPDCFTFVEANQVSRALFISSYVSLLPSSKRAHKIRSTLWTWCQRHSYLLRPIRTIRLQNACQFTTRCGSMGRFSEVPHGCRRRLWWVPCRHFLLHATESNDRSSLCQSRKT